MWSRTVAVFHRMEYWGCVNWRVRLHLEVKTRHRGHDVGKNCKYSIVNMFWISLLNPKCNVLMLLSSNRTFACLIMNVPFYNICEIYLSYFLCGCALSNSHVSRLHFLLFVAWQQIGLLDDYTRMGYLTIRFKVYGRVSKV